MNLQRTNNVKNNAQQTHVDILWNLFYHTKVNIDANCNIIFTMGEVAKQPKFIDMGMQGHV